MQVAQPRPTTRAMLDPTRLCSLRCQFCYWKPDNSFFSVNSWEEQQKEVLDAVARGCDSCDITGGEPLQNPHAVELVKLCVEKQLYPRIITSLICAEKTLNGVLDAGPVDFLVSMHGYRDETHNAIVEVPNARRFQMRRLAKIASRVRYCANYVLVEANQTEVLDWAKMMLNLDHEPPKVICWINYNPHYSAHTKMHDQALANVADMRVAGPLLDQAIDILEEAGVGVNLRYFPMCAVAERHRKNVCSDLHVALDFGEWDGGFVKAPSERTLANAEAYARSISSQNELQTEPCASCGLKQICGGANRIWHQLAMEKFGVETLVPQPVPEGVDPARPYWHYRRWNVLGLDPRRPIPEATSCPTME